MELVLETRKPQTLLGCSSFLVQTYVPQLGLLVITSILTVFVALVTQRPQHPLIKEYSLNHLRDPAII